jgi:hypothetical protein
MQKLFVPAAAVMLLIGSGAAMAAGPGGKAPDINAQNPSKQTIQTPSGKVTTAPTTDGSATTGSGATIDRNGMSAGAKGSSKSNVGSVGGEANVNAGAKVKNR